MPTVIDSLVVTLGLDTSKVTSGRKEAESDLKRVGDAASRTGKQMEAGGKQAAEFFASIRNEALSLIGVLLGATGLEQIVRKTTESMANLGREAANLNVDPQKLGAFSMALERFGASGESTRQTLFGISQAIENFKVTGQGDILRFLNPIGADINNSPFQVLEKFIAFAAAHRNDAPLVNLIGRGLGIDQGTINAALQVKSLAQFQKEYNDALKDAPTKAEVDQAQRLYKAWTELEQAATGLANKVVTDLSPALERVADWGKEEIRQHPELIETITGIVTAITGLGALRISASAMGLTGIAETFGVILSAVDGALLALGALGLLREDLRVGGLNVGEREWLDRWRKEHGLLYGDRRRAAEERQTAQYLRDHPNARLPEGSGPVTFPIPAAQAGANRDAAEKYFLAQGYTPQQVAGILANIQAESSFNPAASYKGHYGLFQWDRTRQQQFAKLFGHSIQQSTVQEQLAFAQWELTHTEKAAGDALRATKTRAAAGSTFSHTFERPGSDKADEFRGVLAQQYTIHPAARQPLPPRMPEHVSSNQIHINSVVVNTKATDARGIARDLASELTVQANRGLA